MLLLTLGWILAWECDCVISRAVCAMRNCSAQCSFGGLLSPLWTLFGVPFCKWLGVKCGCAFDNPPLEILC